MYINFLIMNDTKVILILERGYYKICLYDNLLNKREDNYNSRVLTTTGQKQEVLIKILTKS